MVTKTIPVPEKIEVLPEVLPAPSVVEVGGRIGIPVVIRPWWGCRRQLFERRHRKCGNRVYQDWRGWFCHQCAAHIQDKDIEIVRLKQGRWVCPAGNAAQLKWPRVEGDQVVMWTGRCGARYPSAQRTRYKSATHRHRQGLEVLDFSTTAMLVRINVGNHRLTFLISRDDGLPFVHVVTKSQKTVAEAYDYMVPVPVFNARMHGFTTPRQGDWFFVPREFWGDGRIEATEKKPTPWPANGKLDNTVWYMNHPYLYAPIDGTRHVAELFIHRWPYPLVKGVVTAPDHNHLQLDTWHCAIRNKRPPAYEPGSADSID